MCIIICCRRIVIYPLCRSVSTKLNQGFGRFKSNQKTNKNKGKNKQTKIRVVFNLIDSYHILFLRFSQITW